MLSPGAARPIVFVVWDPRCGYQSVIFPKNVIITAAVLHRAHAHEQQTGVADKPRTWKRKARPYSTPWN